MREKILELRAKGYSYSQITRELKCSNGTVSYHLGDGQKDLTIARVKKGRDAKPKEEKIPKQIVKRKIAPQQAKKVSERSRKDSQPKKDQRTFKTKPIDLSEKIAVKIDSKTTVYCNPGTNVEALKLKYLNRFKRL